MFIVLNVIYFFSFFCSVFYIQVDKLCLVRNDSTSPTPAASSQGVAMPTLNYSIPSNAYSTNADSLRHKPHPRSKTEELACSADQSILNSCSENSSRRDKEASKNGCVLSDSQSVSLPVHPLLISSTAVKEKPHLPPHPLMDGVEENESDDGVEKERIHDRSGESGQCGKGCQRKPSGLSALVAKYLGKPLDKSYQLSNWERRPLWKEQIEYAGRSM